MELYRFQAYNSTKQHLHLLCAHHPEQSLFLSPCPPLPTRTYPPLLPSGCAHCGLRLCYGEMAAPGAGVIPPGITIIASSEKELYLGHCNETLPRNSIKAKRVLMRNGARNRGRWEVPVVMDFS